MYTTIRHELHHARKAWPGTLVHPCLLSCVSWDGGGGGVEPFPLIEVFNKKRSTCAIYSKRRHIGRPTAQTPNSFTAHPSQQSATIISIDNSASYTGRFKGTVRPDLSALRVVLLVLYWIGLVLYSVHAQL
jgi:hypothetical protein